MSAPTVVATDPGGRKAGIVVRRGDQLVQHLLLVRHPDDNIVSWVRQVTDGAAWLYHRAHIGRELWNGKRILVACEDLNEPSPHVRTTNVRGILDTAAVIGGLARAFGDLLILVPPGEFGQGPRQAYPDALWGAREVKGTGVLQDTRSAWDVAGAAATLARMGAGDA